MDVKQQIVLRISYVLAAKPYFLSRFPYVWSLRVLGQWRRSHLSSTTDLILSGCAQGGHALHASFVRHLKEKQQMKNDDDDGDDDVSREAS